MSMRSHQLSMARKVGFTLGDYASNLYWQSISIFLLFFYTDAVGLSARVAGLVYMVPSVIDALADPVMGSIADRTRTKRGRYRPYILYCCVPLGLSFVLLYYKPPLTGLTLVLWMLSSHVIFRFAYTALTIPYTSLNARLTDSSDERSTIAGLRIVFALLAALTVSYFTYPLITRLGAGNDAKGYAGAAAAFALIATLVYPIVYLSTREPAELAASEPRAGLREYWSALAANRAFWILILATCVTFICQIALGSSVLYYFKYYLKAESATRYALTTMSAIGILAIPVWVWITKHIGKRNAWFAAVLWNLALLGLFAAVDLREPVGMTLWLAAVNCGSLGLAMTFWSMLPDTVEYGEWVSGRRTESFIFGLFQLFLKAALGLGAGMFGWLLGAIGYVANIAQTPATLAGLKWIMVVVPAVSLALGGLAMLLYPMKKGAHEAIVADLRLRRTKAIPS